MMKKSLSEVGFEPTPTYVDQNSLSQGELKEVILESGALDHSAILTYEAREANSLLYQSKSH